MKLYIVHGWAYSIEPWSQTVGLLRASSHEIIQLRVPGLTSPSDAVWTVDQYVAWLDSELAGEPHPVVLGHSNGGRIAMHYAIARPSKLHHLILLSSAGVEVNSGQLSTKRRLIKTAAKIAAPLKHIPGARKVVYRLLGSDYGAAPANMQRTLANMLASDRSFDPSPITTPTSIMWGEADRVTSLALGEKLHSLIGQSTFRTYPNWTHAPYISNPDELAAAIDAVVTEDIR